MESLANDGSTDPQNIKNKSIEKRNAAIAQETSRRLELFDKATSTDTLNANGELQKLLTKQVEQDFEKGVTVMKIFLRNNSEEYSKKVESESSGSDSSTDSEGEDTEEETEEESLDDESSEDESSEGETTEKDSTDEESTALESSDEEDTKTEDTVDKENI